MVLGGIWIHVQFDWVNDRKILHLHNNFCGFWSTQTLKFACRHMLRWYDKGHSNLVYRANTS